ncbi:SusD/RagB family nutrient-binding outer membrane lipoprotein [Pedobacter sp. AJM]|uniref:SusD/RagB family nutrient-binding outer membrane lipoprotein n=1 Tax=Pedobacter sp. AJM TaxID=2003629 RepID=UPI0015572981|nr:SusD/RagB family nutrient-binding outer membrane lipoprotein [Pedobacter sp. AJM]
MKNQFKIYVLMMAVSVSLLTACKKDFGDLNSNPNVPLSANTKYLFSSAVIGTRGIPNGAAGLLYVQHMAEFIYTNESRYQQIQYSYDGIYAGPVQDLQRIIKLNTDPATKSLKEVLDNGSNENQIGFARILKAFVMLQITDRWGNVPYREAGLGETNSQPKFDTQKFIYNDLLKELKEAPLQLVTAQPNDPLFGGDITKWKKWANSLRAIVALRMMKTEDVAVAKAAFSEAVTAGLMASNADNAIFNYQSNATYESPWYTNYVRNGRTDYGVSQTVVDNNMKPNADPRLPVFSRTVGSPAVYKGIPYGVTDQYSAGVDGALLGRAIYAQNFPLQLTTYAQMCFTMSEAVLEGWVAGSDAEMISWYNKGIEASMDQWSAVSTNPIVSITTAQKTAYEAMPNVLLTAGQTHDQKLEKIQTQKWLNFYMNNGYEAWAEWRRTGYPVLVPARDAANADKKIPRRQAYPKTESDLNKVNYDAAVAAQGPDALSTRLWWDRS